jgi:hypothetical protein
MDKRTKILTYLFAGVVGSLVVMNQVYPKYIQPLLTIDEENERLAAKLADLEAQEERLNQARFDYRDYVFRVGSFDPDRVQNRVKKQLDELLLSHDIVDGIVSPPRKANLDKKSQISRLTFAVTGEGTLKQVVELLKDISQLPYLLAVNNPKLAPAGRSTKDRDRDAISLNCTIEVLVLPQQKMLGRRLTEEDLRQPAQFVRYQRSDYSDIWARQPFLEHKEVVRAPDPPPVRTPVKTEPKDPPPPPPPPPPPDKRWRDRDQYQLTMALLMSDGASKYDEVMLYNSRSKENRYIRVGEDFDGGDLLFVHQRGVLVGREGERFVYPIGEPLSAPIGVADAADYPELQLASQRLQPPPVEPEVPPSPAEGEPTAVLDGAAAPAVAEKDPGDVSHAPVVPSRSPRQPVDAVVRSPAATETPAPGVAPENVENAAAPPARSPEDAAATAMILKQDTAEEQPVDIGPDGLPQTADGKEAPALAGKVAVPPRTGSGPRARVTNPPGLRNGTPPAAIGEAGTAVLKSPGGVGTKGRLSSRSALLNRPKPPAAKPESEKQPAAKDGEKVDKAEPESKESAEKKPDE